MEDFMMLMYAHEYFGDENLIEERAQRNFRRRRDAFELSEKKFRSLFRLSKDRTKNLLDELAPYIPEASRSSAISNVTKVLATLRFYAGGPYLSNIAQDVYTHMERSCVCRCVEEVTNAINDHLFQRWVNMDLTPNAMSLRRQRFYEMHGFPGTIGVVDDTHIAIVAPPKNHAELNERDYFNYKRYHSINVQVVCDADLKIININARYPGCTNDAFIYAHSNLRQSLRVVHERSNVWLIGDRGYPLEPWLLTPVADDVPNNSPEGRFNRAFLRTRTTVERCIGLLKSRWRCLLKHRVLHFSPNKAGKIVNACAVLHNMCVEDNVDFEDLVPVEDLELEDPNIEIVAQIPMNNLRHGRRVRDRVILTHFT